MPLPIEAVDRLIERLHATYGVQWIREWEGLSPAAVKSLWAAELEALSSPAGMKRIAWAVANLPERVPNAITFKRLCYQAPATEDLQLPAPGASPERVAAELAKLGPIARKPSRTAPGNKDWAHRFIARHDAGEKIRPLYLKWAREALGIPAHGA